MTWLQNYRTKKTLQHELLHGKTFIPRYSSLEHSVSENETHSASPYHVPRSVRFSFSSTGWSIHANYIGNHPTVVTRLLAPNLWMTECKHSRCLQTLVCANPEITLHDALILWLNASRPKFHVFHGVAVTQALNQLEQKFASYPPKL